MIIRQREQKKGSNVQYSGLYASYAWQRSDMFTLAHTTSPYAHRILFDVFLDMGKHLYSIGKKKIWILTLFFFFFS